MPSIWSFFTNGWPTPCIMVRTCAAYVPQRARARRVFSTGATTTSPLLTVTETDEWSGRFKVPPLPLTIISPPETETSVPAGIFMGSFPVRDIKVLPNFKKRLAADFFFACFAIGENPFRRREEEGSAAIAHRHNLLRALVHAAPRLRDTLHARYRVYPLVVVLERDVERLLHLLAFLLDGFHVARVTEFLRDGEFEGRERHRYGRPD